MALTLQLLSLAGWVASGHAACLPNPVPEADRVNVTMQGVSMPLGLVTVAWDSALVQREIFLIVAKEILGFNAESVGIWYWSSAAAYLKVAGCQSDDETLPIEDLQCAEQPWTEHMTLEAWSASSEATVAKMEAWSASVAPVEVKELAYRGQEDMYVFPHSFQPAMEDFVSLTYYKSWNNTWNDVKPYFSKIGDIDPADLIRCADQWGMSQTVIANFKMATGYTDAIVVMPDGTEMFDCWNERWVLGPPCRVPGFNAADCPPYVTAWGWQIESALQKIFFYNMALAYGDGAYEKIARAHRVASYLWAPAKEFSDMGPQKIIFPASNRNEWDAGIRTATVPASKIRAYVSPFIKERYDRLFKTVRNMDLLFSEMQYMMVELTSRMTHGEGYEAALQAVGCDFVQNNLQKVMSWIPSPVECSPGTGVRDANGGFDPSKPEDAVECLWCPPGRFSSDFRLSGSATGQRDVQTFKCVQCPAGEIVAVGGQTQCESCPPGTFSGSPGRTACDLCPIGSYNGDRGAGSCSRCPVPMVTAQEGSLMQIDCLCPQDHVRPCRQSSVPNEIREGCSCDLSVYHPLTSQACVPCKSPELLQCLMGSDERDLPCNGGMENASLNYPRPKPGFYTSFQEPMEVYKCKNTDPFICPGNAVGLCGPNSLGIACGQCEDGYYLSVDGYCLECGEVFKFPVVPILGALGVPIMLVVIIKVGGNNDVTKGQLSPFNELLGLSYVGIIFMQTLGTNIGIMPAAPTLIADSFSWTPAVSDIASQFRFSCFAKMSFELEFALKLMAPVYGAMLFLFVWSIALLIPRVNLNKDVVIGTYLSVFNAFFISVMNLSLTLFQTQQHPNQKWSMISAPQVLTDSELWQNLVYGTAFAVIIYVVGAAAGSAYAIVMAPSKFSDMGFRMRWKCLFLQVRPSVYWWIIVSILKGLFLSLTTVIFDSPMAQTVWLGTGLLFYFLAVFWFLPWRTSTLLCLDVALHYVLAVLCLLMPFFVPATSTELVDVATLFLVVSFFGAIFGACCVLGILRTQSPNAQRNWRLTYEKDARKFVQVFEVMNDEKVMRDVLDGLGDVDFSTAVDVMKLLSVELLGNRETGRLIWRQFGRMGFNKNQERGPDKPELY